MKKYISILLVVLFALMFVLGGCSQETQEPAQQDSTDAVVTQETISEEDAKQVVFNDLSIQETAAENLKVETGETNGKKTYVISFEWSGFDYKYTIDASTGDIVEIMFDGEVL